MPRKAGGSNRVYRSEPPRTPGGPQEPFSSATQALGRFVRALRSARARLEPQVRRGHSLAQMQAQRAARWIAAVAGAAENASLHARLLAEAERVRKTPGVVFADGAAGRRARVAGTGIEVFEVIKAFHEAGDERGRLAEAFHWLSEAQLSAALSYYAAHPAEIDARLEEEEQLEQQHAVLP